MAEGNGKIYVPFISYASENIYWPGSIFVSEDGGRTWEPFAILDKRYSEGVGFYKFVTDQKYGYLYASRVISDETGTRRPYLGTIRFPLK